MQPRHELCSVSRPDRSFLRITRITYLSGRGGKVGMATRYGIDGSGVEFRWGREFPCLPRPAPWSAQPPLQWVPALSQG